MHPSIGNDMKRLNVLFQYIVSFLLPGLQSFSILLSK